MATATNPGGIGNKQWVSGTQVSTTQDNPGTNASGASTQDIITYINQNFGYEAWMLQVPELANILIQAVQDGVDPSTPVGQALLTSQIEATQWWKTTPQTTRNYDMGIVNDPSNYDPNTQGSLANQVQQQIVDQMHQLGITIPSSRIAQMVQDDLRFGWTPAQLQQNVENEYNYGTSRQPNTPGQIPAHMGPNGFLVDDATGRRAYYGPNGEPGSPQPFPGAQKFVQSDGQTVYYIPGDMNYGGSQPANAQPVNLSYGQTGQLYSQYQQLAHDYLVPMSDGTISTWVQQAIEQKSDVSGFTNYLKQQAANLYPQLAPQIQSGQTTKNLLDPYVQSASSLLEVPATAINLEDPKWGQSMIQKDPSTGQNTLMSLTDYNQQLRKNPQYGWQYTTNGRSQSSALESTILKAFGQIGQ